MIYQLHSLVRYAVLLVALAALGYALYGILARRPYSIRMHRIASAFNWILFLEVLLGSMLIVSARFRSPGLVPHILLTLVATGVAVLSSRSVQRRPLGERSYARHLIGVLTSLAFIVGGVLSLGYGLL
jgi:hypothetical protein